MTKVVNSTAPKQRNATSFGADLVHFAQIKGEGKSAPLFMVLTHEQDIARLAKRQEHAVPNSKTDSERAINIAFFHGTAEGDVFAKRLSKMDSYEKPDAEQKSAINMLKEQENYINTMLIRTVKTYRGIVKLRDNGRTVKILKVAGSKAYSCYTQLPDDQEAALFELTAADLGRLVDLQSDIDPKLPSRDLKKLLSGGKQGKANEDKGSNGDRLQPSQFAKVATQLDTSVAAILKDDGSIGATDKQTKELFQLWALLDATMTAEQKEHARQVYMAAGVAKEAKEIATEVKAKQAKKTASK